MIKIKPLIIVCLVLFWSSGYSQSIPQNNQPIYVLNDSIYTNRDSAMIQLNPTYIESIEVLSNREAVKKYGVLGVNGAILIATNRKKTIKTI